MRLQRMSVLVVGVGLLLGACTTYYPPPQATVAQQYKDEVECQALAEQAAGPDGLLFRGAIRHDAMAKCLISRNWSKEKSIP
jgi:hypothetical protein